MSPWDESLHGGELTRSSNIHCLLPREQQEGVLEEVTLEGVSGVDPSCWIGTRCIFPLAESLGDVLPD